MKLVDLIYIFFALAIVFSCKLKEQVDEKFDSNTMNNIKGILSILIVLFHLSQMVRGGIINTLVGDTGYLSVAVFFFISGYGLYTRNLETEGEYCKGLLVKRLPKTLLPWLFATFIYFVYWLCEGGFSRIIQICDNSQNGYLLITNSWFVVTIIIFYFIFWVAFSVSKNNNRKGLAFASLGVTCYIVVAYLIGLGGWWFYSSFGFVLGMLWKANEGRIYSFIKNKFLLFWAIFLCGFFVGYCLRLINSKTIQSPMIYNIALLLASAAFTGMIFTVLKRIDISNRIWTFLGSISFEIYLIHELVYSILRSNSLGIYISNDLLYVTLVLVISVIAAFGFNLFIKKISFFGNKD